jgi:myo-inositol-1(or 4)-monophosphatase
MVGRSWLPIFKGIANAVGEAIEPLVGTTSANEIVSTKKDGDTTRRIDAMAEQAAIKVLQESGFPFVLISEESGYSRFGGETSQTIVLDPLDGSANAIRGIPAYSLSVGVADGKHMRDMSEALVVDLANHIFYEAELRKGARRNGDPISTSKVDKLSDSMISADLNIVDLRSYMKKIIRILNMAKRKRYLGTNALEVCLVACGKYDAFVDLRGMNRVTDIAAGYLILKESGGVIVDEGGVDIDSALLPTSRLSFIAAANRALSKNILINIASNLNGV